MLRTMLGHHHFLRLVAFSLLFSGCLGAVRAASTDAYATIPAPAPASQPTSNSAGVPAGLASDAAESRKPFTISASLREEYDSNIFTSSSNATSSMETDISPSILYDLPMDDSDFSLRETFDATYYSNRPGGQFDFSDEFVMQYNHNFSDRFSLNAAEQFRYYTEPSLFQSVGTLYRSGAYISNTINLGFNAQWTPLVSTTTTYANTIIDYQDSSTATTQNNMENTASQSIGFAILPRINLSFGGIIDNIDYKFYDRGYTSYTGNTGIDWQILPSMSLGVRVGGTVIDAQQTGTSVTPYASIIYNWKLGARSSLAFNYAHEVVPTDVANSNGQIADRFDATFRYDLTTRLSAHLEGIFTHGNYTESLIQNDSVPAFTENDYAIDTGLVYTLNSNVSFDLGYIFSGVSSGENFRDYSRNQVYIGVRGTY